MARVQRSGVVGKIDVFSGIAQREPGCWLARKAIVLRKPTSSIAAVGLQAKARAAQQLYTLGRDVGRGSEIVDENVGACLMI